MGGDDGALTGGETGDGIEFVGDDGAHTGGETGDGIEFFGDDGACTGDGMEESEDRIAQAFNYVIEQF